MNKKELNKIINMDLYRYYGLLDLNKLKKQKFSPQIKFLIEFRKVQYYKKNSIGYMYHKIKLVLLRNKYHFQISENTKIGYGFLIHHFGRIIINSKTLIGNNCDIATGVLIGQENRGIRKGTPKIGNEVYIGANAVIVGNITIGNNVLIAPNSYVNFDVPNNSIVLGNPGKIYEKQNATDEYITNKINI